MSRWGLFSAGIDEPICMVVEPNHQGWYGLEEYSAIADSWLCEDGDACYNSEYDFNANDAIDASDLAEFVSDYYLDDRPLTESIKYYGYVFDGSGNVVAMTFCNDPNETGNPTEVPYFVESYVYDPFGAVTIYDPNGVEISQSEIGNSYMFTARRFDCESGLYYYRLRMYNPTVGRFMQTDPIGYYDSMNMYQYCGNNPTNFVDPWGLYQTILNPYIPPKSNRKKPRPPHQIPALPGTEGSREMPHPLTRKDLKDLIRTAEMPYTAIGMLWFDLGSFYNNSAHYYSYNGKKHLGGAVNYAGVGAAAAYFGFRDGSQVPNLFNLGYGHLASDDEKKFFDLGYDLYNELHPDNSKPLPPYTWPIY